MNPLGRGMAPVALPGMQQGKQPSLKKPAVTVQTEGGTPISNWTWVKNMGNVAWDAGKYLVTRHQMQNNEAEGNTQAAVEKRVESYMVLENVRISAEPVFRPSREAVDHAKMAREANQHRLELAKELSRLHKAQ